MQKQIKINNILFTQIENRYHFLHRDRYGIRTFGGKLIVDSFYPQYVCREIANVRQPSLGAVKNSYAISDRIAKELGCKQIHISELITMLGFTKTDISKLLQGVKNKGLNIILVGIGGTGSNFLYFMHKMTEWVGKDEIFVSVSAYDADKYDVPNMLRIPFIPKLPGNFTNGPQKVVSIPPELKLLSRLFSSNHVNFLPQTLTSLVASRSVEKKNTILYGAPDMATREWMSNSDFTFIAATHKDNEYSLIENPEIDQDLIIETYGKINLSMFFMNHLSMTIRFLEELRDRTEPFGTYPGPVKEDGSPGELIKRMNHTIDSQDFMVKHEQKMLTGFKAGAKKLYIPSIDGRNLDTALQLREE